MMAGSWDDSHELGSQSDDSFQYERQHIEPIYDAFICPLTKQIMRNPVTLENGQTFEREAIENWFNECKENNRKLLCPLTLKELKTTDMNPSIALRNTIEEWNARNEAVQLDMARKSLNIGCPETDILRALRFVQHLCNKNLSNKHIIRNADLIPMIVDMLKSSSRRVRCRALDTLRVVVEDDDDNKEIMAEGDNVRTIVKFLSHQQSKEREEAVSLLYELSKYEAMVEKIGSVNGAILILVGMTSSKSENVLTVEKADKTLGNLEKNENNVRQMAENGRLRPLLTLILEGTPEIKLSMASYLGDLDLSNDVKVYVATNVGSALINLMKSTNIQSREAALKALNQVSSCEASAKILVDQGILSPLVKDLFTSQSQLPMRLKEISTTILANIVASDCDFDSIPVGPNHQTLVSEEDDQRKDSPSSLQDNQCRRFSLAEIKLATNDFDDAFVIGKGGFGNVYKGKIDLGGGTNVAIKRLKLDSSQGAIEFQAELEMLSKFRHSHIVSLLGYHEASDKREMILVYEYMLNGSLEDHLHKRRANGSNYSQLTWIQRLNICIGAARGLDYLHTGTSIQSRVLHRDIKSSNILLDENFSAKISDFGLSRIGPANLVGTTNVFTDQIRGTFGYMDAEYFATHRLTRKSDVYAFGVVLLEVLCGRPALDFTLDEEKHSLTVWVKDCIREGNIDQIIDPCLKGQTTSRCLKEFGKIAYECILFRSKDRPTMTKVLARLEFVLALTLQKHGGVTVAQKMWSLFSVKISSN